ncbi:hemerythrin domain-containing protein [Sphingopyxis granuli]|uniref:hemerythrin domain-containing protein n=1 Tax=Sphingopyxis granuli TaxID=267128 RepID=UPI001F532AA1|nr:hemerythrin domain-containing protein [Sphingopyxis granuli]UNK78090.1 hemerythrin domain-containing protein [Sphingopyxis granuli]
MSQATDVLKHEHDAILMALKILDKISNEARQGNATSADILKFLGFLREFADTCHHGKEEGLLFPAMIEAGLPADGGPVSVMLSEHEQGRALVAAMANAIEPTMSPTAFSEAAAAYIAHMRAHIEKENTVLFPMADQVVAAEVLDGLVGAFDRHEEEVMGSGRHDELHDMLKELKVKYLDA